MDESQAWSLLYKKSDTSESCISRSPVWLLTLMTWGDKRVSTYSPQWPPGPGDQATVRRPPPAPSGRQNCHGVNEWNTFSLYRPDHLLNFYQSRYLHYTTTHLLNTTFHFSLAFTQNQKQFREVFMRHCLIISTRQKNNRARGYWESFKLQYISIWEGSENSHLSVYQNNLKILRLT